SVFIRGADHFIGQFSEYERIVPSFVEHKMTRTAARSHTALRHLLKFAFIDFQCNQLIGTKIHCNKILPVGSLRYKMGMRAVLAFVRTVRSEEHTSELQSRFDLVCRLLLEKKKRNRPQRYMEAT